MEVADSSSTTSSYASHPHHPSSRSSSPAGSDITEVPSDLSPSSSFRTSGSASVPRTIASDIEHIKTLIARADSVSPDSSSITAQVFRSRSGSTGSIISQQRIFHELDLLKRRVRYERPGIERRASQMDPETESESEDAIDEREEELEGLRAQLVHERRQNEELLASAEERIDGLMVEKEGLLHEVQAHAEYVEGLQEEIQEVTEDRENQLALAQQEMEELREQMHATEASMALMQRHPADFELRADTAEVLAHRIETEVEQRMAAKDRELLEVQSQLAELEKKLYDSSAQLREKNAELSQATEHAYRMFDESDRGHENELRELREQLEQRIAALRADVEEANEARDVAHKGWADKVARMKTDWAEEIAQLKAEGERRSRALDEGWSSKTADAAQSHQAELSRVQSAHQKQLADLRADSERRAVLLSESSAALLAASAANSDQGSSAKSEEPGSGDPELRAQLDAARSDIETVRGKLASAQEKNWQQLIQFQDKHKQTIAAHAEELAALRQDHRHMLEDLETQNDALERQVNELKTLHREVLSPGQGDGPAGGNKALSFLEECTRQLQKVHEIEVRGMRNDYDTTLREREAQSVTELKNVQQALQEALEFAKAEGMVALDAAYRDYEEMKRSLEERLVAAEEAAKSLREELDKSPQDHLESLQQEHERAVRMLLRNQKSELSSIEETHQQQLSTLEASLRAQIESEYSNARPPSSSSRESSHADITALKREHKRELSRARAAAQNELHAARTDADEELEDRLREQAEAHRRQLDDLHQSLNVELTHLHVKLEEASLQRDDQLKEVELRHRSALEAAEQTSRALQARLDAEAMGRAEAERSLAGFKKSRFEEDRGVESRHSMRKSIVLLEAERDSLARMLAGSPSLSHLEEEEETSPDNTLESLGLEDEEDVTKLKQRLLTAEQERRAAQDLAEQRLVEMTRQTEFLTKELEDVMAQRNAAQAAASRGSTDISVQTEPVSLLGPEALREPKSDPAVSHAHRDALQQQQAPEISGEIVERRKSFEKYLMLAQEELSSLGSTTNGNETFFAEKTRQHASGVQAAKEKLAVTYRRKFRALKAERERMERAVGAKSAADFSREHEYLFASYGIDDPESAGGVGDSSTTLFQDLAPKLQLAVRAAEQKLVGDYQQRLTKRRSQIAIKHAEKFRALTKEFHRKTAELVGGQEGWEGHAAAAVAAAASHDPEEADVARKRVSVVDRNALAKALEAAAAAHTKPKRPISLSAPGSSTSIPRAFPFAGRRDTLTPAAAPEVPLRSPRREFFDLMSTATTPTSKTQTSYLDTSSGRSSAEPPTTYTYIPTGSTTMLAAVSRLSEPRVESRSSIRSGVSALSASGSAETGENEESASSRPSISQRSHSSQSFSRPRPRTTKHSTRSMFGL